MDSACVPRITVRFDACACLLVSSVQFAVTVPHRAPKGHSKHMKGSQAYRMSFTVTCISTRRCKFRATYPTHCNKDDKVCKECKSCNTSGKCSMQLLLQPVNWTALTLQSTVTDKARESWQQQLDLEAANLLSDICSEANGMNAIVIHLQKY